jgi:hypothetical protein
VGLWQRKDKKQGKNCFDVSVDDQYQKTIIVTDQKDTLLLADKLNKGVHTVKIIKRSESNSNVSVFYGFVLDNKCKLQPLSSEPSRKIIMRRSRKSWGHWLERSLDGNEGNPTQYPDRKGVGNITKYGRQEIRSFNHETHERHEKIQNIKRLIIYDSQTMSHRIEYCSKKNVILLRERCLRCIRKWSVDF